MDTIESTRSPVFVHSLFRSGSTYLFDKFRRTGQFTCFQEPCNEALIDLDTRPESFLKQPDFDNQMLRHPTLEAPYFHEFYQIREHLKGLYKKSFSYDEFFTGSRLSREQEQFFGTLIYAAPDRPLLQFCRSAGRVGALKNRFGGCHVHLWREPRGQWWSYKISSYFDAATQATYAASQLPLVLSKVRSLTHFQSFRGRSVNREIGFYRSHPMCARESYILFFALWLYSFIECERHAAVTICVNKLYDSEYRARITQALSGAGAGTLSFADAKLMHSAFSPAELAFYEEIEDEVAQLFCEFGYAKADVSEAMSAGRTGVRLMPERVIDALTEEIHKLRALVISHADSAGAQAERRPFLRMLSLS